VVAERRFRAAQRVERPGARVVGPDGRARGPVAAPEEQPSPARARVPGDVVEPRHRLQVPVEDPQVRGEGVHEVMAPRTRADGDAGGRRQLEGAECAARQDAVARLVQRAARPGQGLRRGALDHPAGPACPAATEGERPLPRQIAGPPGAEGGEAVRGRAQPRPPAGGRPRQALAPEGADAAPRGEPLDLQAAAGVVLEHDGVRPGHEARPGRRQRTRPPEGDVAAQREEGRVHVPVVSRPRAARSARSPAPRAAPPRARRGGGRRGARRPAQVRRCASCSARARVPASHARRRAPSTLRVPAQPPQPPRGARRRAAGRPRRGPAGARLRGRRERDDPAARRRGRVPSGRRGLGRRATAAPSATAIAAAAKHHRQERHPESGSEH
jgi:translation initiation factor IF-2